MLFFPIALCLAALSAVSAGRTVDLKQKSPPYQSGLSKINVNYEPNWGRGMYIRDGECSVKVDLIDLCEISAARSVEVTLRDYEGYASMDVVGEDVDSYRLVFIERKRNPLDLNCWGDVPLDIQVHCEGLNASTVL